MTFRFARPVLATTATLLGVLLAAGVPAIAATPSPQQQAAALMKRAVAVQGEFVDAAVKYEQATSAAAKARTAAQQAQVEADRAAQAGEKARAELGRYGGSLYANGGIGDEQPLVGLITLLTSAEPERVLHQQAVVDYLNDERGLKVADLIRIRDEATAAADRAKAAHQAARDAEEAAAKALDAIQAKADTLAIEIDEALAKTGSTGLVSAEQAALNQAAKDAWNDYLAALSKAGVVAPKAAALADPAHLPTGLVPLVGTDGKPVPGVAAKPVKGGQVKVLSSQAINAVTGALRQIGRPYVPDQAGPEAFDCGGLVSAMWGTAGVSFSPVVSTQWVTGARVPAEQAQPGDLVFLSDSSSGVHHVGMLVAPNLMVAASSQTFMVSVQMVPGSVFGVVRPTLKPSKVNALPKSAGGDMRCGSADDLPSLDQSTPDVALQAGMPLPTRAGRAWGGYANGMIPGGALCSIGGGTERLRCDAANAFNALSAAYQAKFGSPICITDAYRSYPDQIRVFRERPGFAAVPGTSNHGWGLATDLGCGINQFGTAQHAWMKANAPQFGFFHPGWAEPGGSMPEPWHWEFGRIS